MFINKTEEAIEILEKMLNNESVSRWSVLRLHARLNKLIYENEEYHELQHEVNLIADLAKESI